MSQTSYPALPPTSRTPRSQAKPETNFGLAAFSLLGAWPLAIVAMMYAYSSTEKWKDGDYHGARRAGEQARHWAIASWCVGAIAVALVLAL